MRKKEAISLSKISNSDKQASTPIGQILNNLQSQQENSSNKDIESDLSGGEYNDREINDIYNKNDNLSEVSEESAYEEEDEEFYEGDAGVQTLKKDNKNLKEELK